MKFQSQKSLRPDHYAGIESLANLSHRRGMALTRCRLKSRCCCSRCAGPSFVGTFIFLSTVALSDPTGPLRDAAVTAATERCLATNRNI